MRDSDLLLNYMYQKGFTEEDMYDEHTIRKVRGSFGYLAHKIKLGMKALAERILAAFERMKEVFSKIIAESAEPATKTKLPIAIEYGTRLPMRSQVMVNKPKHTVRKIIR